MSLGVKRWGLCLDIPRFSMVGGFLHIDVRDHDEAFLFSHSKVISFSRNSDLDRDAEYGPLTPWSYCFSMIAFGTMVRYSFPLPAW